LFSIFNLRENRVDQTDNKKGRACQICGKKLDILFPFKCSRCGNYYCNEHRLPESHQCIVAPRRNLNNWIREEKKFKNYSRGEKNFIEVKNQNYHREPPYHNSEKKDKKDFWDRRYKEYGRTKRYTLPQTLRYKLRKIRIHPWILITLVIMFVIAIIHQFYEIQISGIDLSVIFYLLELIVVLYLMFRLIKISDRIHVGSDLRLFGLRMLSGFVSFIGIFLLWMMFFGSLFAFFDKNLASFFYFGAQFRLPFFVQTLFYGVSLGLVVIGAYLYFKFQRRTGNFVWFGRIR